MNCWLLRTMPEDEPQRADDVSFIGGHLRLPAESPMPVCGLCQSNQTFFFQVAFPSEHSWMGLSLAVFACTECADEDLLIPTFLHGQLAGADIPDGFLNVYQRNFRFLVFETATAIPRTDYVEKIKFQRWRMEPTPDTSAAGNKIGGEPNWVLNDEAPATYRSDTPMVFLLQTEEDFRFATVPGASPQMQIDFSGPRGALEPSPDPFYELFIGNALYLFGTVGATERLVYAIVQSD